MSDSGRILYITDQYKISQGYEPAFGRMLNRCGITRKQVVTADIYRLVEQPLKKYRNEKTIRYNPEKLPAIEAAFRSRINVIKPTLIVVSCPAVLGVLAKGDIRIATIDKMRGGVYEYEGIPTIVVPPITAMHRNVDARIVRNEDGEADTQEPYKVLNGSWILHRDWEKVGRFFHGKQRKLPPFRYSVCRTTDDLYCAARFLSQCMLVSVDIETGTWPAQITCVGFTGIRKDGAVRSFVIPFWDKSQEDGCFWSLEDHEIAWSVLFDILNNPVPKTMQNGLYDLSYFVRDRLGIKNYNLDSMYMWWSVYAELPKTLDFITSILQDTFQYWKDDIKGQENETDRGNMESYWRYNALDCYYTLFNTITLMGIIGRDSRAAINFRDTMLRAFSGFQMSLRGVKADFGRREEHREILTAERDEALAKFRFMIADNEFNVNSPDQKCALLYDVLGVTPRNARGRKADPNATKGEKSRSAGAIPLKLAKTDHPFFRIIVEAMEACMVPDKQISNVCNMKLTTDRFRTSFNPVGTETSRFSSKASNFWDGGNAQNIRKEYRDWFVVDDGCIFLDIDYSQSDDVFMAYESQDPEKIAVVESGQDGHAVNGELFFGRPYDWIVAGKKAQDPLVVHPITGVRQLSKRIVHGTNFQMAALTLYITMGREAVVAAAKLLGFSEAESWDQARLVQLCGNLMGRYRKKYKRLTTSEYYAEIAKELSTNGKLTTAFGLSRTFLGDPKDNGTQREATAFIGQGDTAGNMNRVMAEIDFGFIPPTFRDGPNPHAREKPLRMDWDSHGFRYHLQVHDNFLSQLNTRHPNWKEAAHNLLQVMNRPVIIHGRQVSIRAEAEVGIKWGKGMLEWDGKDVHDLDRLALTLTTQTKVKETGYGKSES